MIKIKSEFKTALERGNRVEDGMEAFNLSVVQPKKGTKGKVVFTATIHAQTVSEAVKLLREQVEGSGWIVLQSSQVDAEPTGDNTMTAALRRAYEKAAA